MKKVKCYIHEMFLLKLDGIRTHDTRLLKKPLLYQAELPVLIIALGASGHVFQVISNSNNKYTGKPIYT